MEKDTSFWEEVSQQVVKDFGTRLTHWLDMPFSQSEEQLKAQLAPEIEALFSSQISTMRHILYRIDVSENQLGKILADCLREDASKVVAQVIISREAKKVETRRKYRRGRLN